MPPKSMMRMPRQRGDLDPLLHPRRRALLESIAADPGQTFRGLARGAQIAMGVAHFHLMVLNRGRLIRIARLGAATRFFPADLDEADFARMALLREPELRLLLDWVAAHPSACQLAIVAAMGARGANRSTTQHRLGRLVESGLLQRTRQGRRIHYHAPNVLTAPSRAEAQAAPSP